MIPSDIHDMSDEALRATIDDLRAAGHVPSQMGSRETVDGNNRLLSALEELECRDKGFRLVTVGFEDRAFGQAYIDGERWNGWLMPLVPADELPRFVAAFNGWATDEPDAELIIARMEGDCLILTDPQCPEEPDRYQPIQVAGIPVPVYALGGGLCWEEVNRVIYRDCSIMLTPTEVSEFDVLTNCPERLEIARSGDVYDVEAYLPDGRLLVGAYGVVAPKEECLTMMKADIDSELERMA